MITEESLLTIPKAFKFKNRRGSWEWVVYTPLIPTLVSLVNRVPEQPGLLPRETLFLLPRETLFQIHRHQHHGIRVGGMFQ